MRQLRNAIAKKSQRKYFYRENCAHREYVDLVEVINGHTPTVTILALYRIPWHQSKSPASQRRFPSLGMISSGPVLAVSVASGVHLSSGFSSKQ